MSTIQHTSAFKTIISLCFCLFFLLVAINSNSQAQELKEPNLIDSESHSNTRLIKNCTQKSSEIKRDIFLKWFHPQLQLLKTNASKSLNEEIEYNDFYNSLIQIFDGIIELDDKYDLLKRKDVKIEEILISAIGSASYTSDVFLGEELLSTIVDTIVTEAELILSGDPKKALSFITSKYLSICNNTFSAILIGIREKQLQTLIVISDVLFSYYICCEDRECISNRLKADKNKCAGNTADWLTCMAAEYSINYYGWDLEEDLLSWLGWEVGLEWVKDRINSYLNKTIDMYNTIKRLIPPNNVSVNIENHKWFESPQTIEIESQYAKNIYCKFNVTYDGTVPDDPPEPTIADHDIFNKEKLQAIEGENGKFQIWAAPGTIKHVKVRFRGHNENGFGTASSVYSYIVDLREESKSSIGKKIDSKEKIYFSKLEGRWVLCKVNNVRKMDKDLETIEFKGNIFTHTSWNYGKNDTERGIFTINNRITPNQINIELEKVTLVGIYKFENNDLTICFRHNDERPKNFTYNDNIFLLVLKPENIIDTHDIDISRNGIFYGLDLFTNKLFKYDPNGGKTNILLENLQSPWRLERFGNKIYFIEHGKGGIKHAEGKLAEYDIINKKVNYLSETLFYPSDLHVDSQGNIYVLCPEGYHHYSDSNKLIKFSGKEQKTILNFSNEQSYNFVIDSQGYVYISYSFGRLMRCDLSNPDDIVIIDKYYLDENCYNVNIRDMTIDDNDNIYLAFDCKSKDNKIIGKIAILNKEKNEFEVIKLHKKNLERIEWMEVDSEGNIYIGQSVYEYLDVNFINRIITINKQSDYNLPTYTIENEADVTSSSGDESEWQKIIKAKQSMTKAQWVEFKKQYEGKQIRWNGFIVEVSKCDKDKCQIHIMMTKTMPMKVMGMVFSQISYYIEKEKALTLKLRQQVEFKGVINHIRDCDENFVKDGIQVKFKTLEIE